MITRSQLLSVALAVLAASSSGARTQSSVFIVDAALGAGAHYQSLPVAVAAVPDGSVLLIRPGTYRTFSVTGKALTLIGLDRDQVVVQGEIFGPNVVSIRALPAGRLFVLRSVTLTVPVLSYEVRVEECRGTVLFDDVVGLGGGPATAVPLFAVDASDDVQWHDCRLVPPAAPVISAVDSTLHVSYSVVQPMGYGFTAVQLQRSRLVAVASTIRGGDGVLGTLTCSIGGFNGGPGGNGIEMDASVVVALRTPVSGGRGGSTTVCGGAVTYHDGGDGLVLDNGSSTTFAGGAPTAGGLLAGAVGASPGSPAVVAPGSTLTVDPGARPSSGDTLGFWQRGTTVEYLLEAAPGSPAVLLLAYDGSLLPVEPLTPGSLLARFVLSIPLPTVPAGGQLHVSQWLPRTWPIGQTYFGQFATLEPGPSRLWLTNRFPLPAVW